MMDISDSKTACLYLSSCVLSMVNVEGSTVSLLPIAKESIRYSIRGEHIPNVDSP